MFALEENQFRFCLDCVAPCLEDSLLSLAELRLEEVWKSFTEHTKRVDVWLKNDCEKVRNSLTWFSQSFGSNPLKADVGDNVLILIFVHSHLVLDNVNSSAACILRCHKITSACHSKAKVQMQ